MTTTTTRRRRIAGGDWQEQPAEERKERTEEQEELGDAVNGIGVVGIREFTIEIIDLKEVHKKCLVGKPCQRLHQPIIWLKL